MKIYRAGNYFIIEASHAYLRLTGLSVLFTTVQFTETSIGKGTTFGCGGIAADSVLSRCIVSARIIKSGILARNYF